MHTEVTQSRLGMGDRAKNIAPGNCFQAAIASVLGLQLSDVPDEADTIDRLKAKGVEIKSHASSWCAWWLELQQWLAAKHGLQMADVKPRSLEGVVEDFYHIASGKSPRGLMHSVVWLGASMVWDPHPSREGLVEDPTGYTIFLPLSPGIQPTRDDAKG